VHPQRGLAAAEIRCLRSVDERWRIFALEETVFDAFERENERVYSTIVQKNQELS